MNAVVHQIQPSQAESAFALSVRQARALAASTLVPQSYRGEDGLGNVMVALEIANRIGASPLSVMQSLHVIQGRPSWSASFLIATVNACGRFSPMRFEVVGEDPADKDYRVRAYATDKEAGERCDGPWITWKMVEAEGWSKKSGSKWLTMPGLMFMYRAAAFWSRLYAPELSLGIHTAEEVQDIAPQRLERSDLTALEAKLVQRGAAETDEKQEAEPAPASIDHATGEILTTKQIKAAIECAETMEELTALGEAIASIPDDAERQECEVMFDSRSLSLTNGGEA